MYQLIPEERIAVSSFAYLPACFRNPVPTFFSCSSSMSSFRARPVLPANAPFARTRVPGFRFLVVCGPVRFEGPLGCRRRRFREDGRARVCAPPHCKDRNEWRTPRMVLRAHIPCILEGHPSPALGRPPSRSRRDGCPTTKSLFAEVRDALPRKIGLREPSP